MYNDSFLDTLAHAYRDARDKNESLAKYLIGVFHEIGVLHNDGGPGSGNHGHKGVPGQVGGSAPSGSGSGPKFVGRSKRDFFPATSYMDSPVFQKAVKAAKEALQKREQLSKRIEEIDTELKTESKPKPRKYWTDKDMIDDLLGRRPKILTERGEQLQKERKKVFNEKMDADHQFTDEGEKLNKLKKEAHRREIESFHPEPLVPAQNDDYEGFTLEETSNSYGDEYLHNGQGVICEMTPKEYLERCAYEIFDDATIESCVSAIDEEIARGYAKKMRDGTKFHLPYLNYKQGGQEGRHRAYAAYLCGIDKIPVLIIGRSRRQDGGPGSGNFGHEGRPGEVGGSAPSDDASDTPTATNPQAISKRRANETIASILGNGESSDDRRDKLKKIVDQLHPGSKVQMPDTWDNDDGTHVVYIKDDVNGESRWYQKYDGQKMYMSEDDLVYYMLSEYDNFNGNLCKVTSSAESEAEKRAAVEEWNKKYNWRYNASIWQDHGALTEQASIHMQKFDLDNCGYGFELTGSDGKKYIKDQYLGWVDSDTYKKADMRKLKNPTFEGDFFDINLGMNGVSAESCAKVREVYENLPEKLKTAYEDRFRNQSCFVQNPEYGVSHCDAYGNVSLTPDSSARTVFHEYGHSIDFYSEKINEFPSQHLDRLGNSPQQYRQDVEAMAKVVGLSTDGNGNLTESEADRTQKYWSWAKNQEKKIAGFENVSDAISALTHASCGEALYGGHESSYWYKVSSRGAASMRSAEFWAEYCQMKAFGQEEALDLMKQIAPNLYDACEKTYMEVIENG